jgi:hypothetical protein
MRPSSIRAVRRHLAGRHAELAAQQAGEAAAAVHAVRDVVAEQQVVAPDRPQVEEAVEARHALDDRRRQADPVRDPREQLAGQPTRVLLHLAQDLHQGLPASAVPLQDELDMRGGGVGQGHRQQRQQRPRSVARLRPAGP